MANGMRTPGRNTIPTAYDPREANGCEAIALLHSHRLHVAPGMVGACLPPPRENRMKRSASAHWSGGIKDGQGTMSTDTGVLRESPYGFKSRFEDGPGTNPEELIAAAHAGCYAMALSLALGEAGFTAESIDTNAVVTLARDGDGFAITEVALTCRARVPRIDTATFDGIARATKLACPVSKVLKATITLDARLES
jgi:osmotically inducible protein OsmC